MEGGENANSMEIYYEKGKSFNVAGSLRIALQARRRKYSKRFPFNNITIQILIFADSAAIESSFIPLSMSIGKLVNISQYDIRSGASFNSILDLLTQLFSSRNSISGERRPKWKLSTQRKPAAIDSSTILRSLPFFDGSGAASRGGEV